jgi:hypothetical protein
VLVQSGAKVVLVRVFLGEFGARANPRSILISFLPGGGSLRERERDRERGGKANPISASCCNVHLCSGLSYILCVSARRSHVIARSLAHRRIIREHARAPFCIMHILITLTLFKPQH